MHKLENILAAIAPTPSGVNAARRAALVAREHGARLTLLDAGEHGSRHTAGEPLESLAEQLQAEFGVRAATCAPGGDALRATVDASRDAQLLVLGSARGNALRDWLMGTAAERIVRLSRAPVLVVKRRAVGEYRRVLAAVELTADGRGVAASAMAFARRARIDLFHVLRARQDAALRAADVPDAVLSRARRNTVERARATLLGFVAHLKGAGRAAAAVDFGPAGERALAREAALGAELSVVGKHGRKLLGDFVLGRVTQQLLARSHSDVLVLRESGAPAGAWLPAPA